MHWPTITTLAGELRLWNQNTEFASPVFFLAWPSSDEWTIDTRPRRDAECSAQGHIPGYKHRFNARELARQLLNDAKASCNRGRSVRAVFMQPGTDDYGPSPQFFPQFYTSDRLNGLGATAPEPLGCPRCHAELRYGQNCPYCARDGVFVLGDRKSWVDEPAYDYNPDPKWLPTRWEADVMAIPVTPPPAPPRPPARTPRRTTRTTRRRR